MVQSELPTKIMKRISRACLRCRQRKSKCDLGSLGSPGEPPCKGCLRDGSECVLVKSNRGGRRPRKSVLSTSSADDRRPIQFASPESSITEETPEQISERGVFVPTNIEETLTSTDLHRTSDALNLLSQAAEGLTNAGPQEVRNSISHRGSITGNFRRDEIVQSSENGLQYPLVSKGLLSTVQIYQLIARFEKYYYPFFPIIPRRSLEPASLPFLAAQEPHLLTAMITVASRDLPNGEQTLEICSSYMHELVAQLSAGKKCDVEAVEALLLLAEWEPQDSLAGEKKVGCGEEDRAAWMHVGLALRIGYFLGLDRTSIKNDDEERAVHYNRRRLTWAACYVSDRQLSARIGRAFWSRGPGPLAGLGRHDFPTLQPLNPGDDDHASIFQASLDLTQLFSNVHDVLYSGMGSSMKAMLIGNYVKYVDDFRAAIVGWKSIWGTLTCSANMKASLQMSYEYLRLYTNAYAFQATTSRAVAAKTQNSQGGYEIPMGGPASMPDARFVYESVDAAKSLLTIVNNYVDADSCLRYLPLRYYLYTVNSAVFLYKAWSFGVLSSQEKTGVRRMISDCIHKLQISSVRPHDFPSRYAQLLELLWRRKDGADRSDGPNVPLSDPCPVTTPSRLSAPYDPQDDFSWLDLQAVGEFVSGEQDLTGFGDGYSGFMSGRDLAWNDSGWAEGEELNRFF